MERLLLAGYRIMPPWSVPDAMRDPRLPGRVLTASSCLVDAVPDDDAWFPTLEAALAVAQAAANRAQLLAVGIPEDVATEAIRYGLRAGEHPWPADLPILGYELIGLEGGGFHSWLCYQGTPSWAHRTTGVRVNAHGLLDDLVEARTVADAAEQLDSGLPPIPWIPVAIGEPSARPSLRPR